MADSESILDGLEDLDPVEKTLLLPLIARAWGQRWPWQACLSDASAERVLRQLGCHDAAYMPDPVTLSLILWRTQQMVERAHAHFALHPKAWGVNLGAGLSDYFQWLDNGFNHWLDADLACVTHLRSRCMMDRSRVSDVALDLCERDWWSEVAAQTRSNQEPMWIMLEGVLIYLRPAQVHQVLETLGEQAPEGSWVAFDVIPQWMVGWPVHVPRTTTQAAVFQWGLNDIHELEAIHPRLHLDQVESSVPLATGWPWVTSPGWNPLSPYAVVVMRVT